MRNPIGLRFQFSLVCSSLAVLATIVAFQFFPNVSLAQEKFEDRIQLKSGGQLIGKIVFNGKDESGRTMVAIKTRSGGLIKLDKSKLIKRIWSEDDKRAYAAYAVRRDSIDLENPDDHWKMYRWCKEQERSSRFSKEIEYHLLSIIDLDPNDVEARKALNYRNFDGKWVLKDRQFAGHGYVKKVSRWVSKSQLAIIEGDESSEDTEGAKNKQFKRWKKNRERMADSGRAELYQIATADYAPKIFSELNREKNLKFRLMYVDALGRIPNGFAQSRLAALAVEDKDEAVRELALTLLEQEHFDSEQIARFLTKYFKSPKNYQVQRAGFIIGELNAESVLSELIGALVTRHTINNPAGVQQGRTATNFSQDGQSGGLNLGGPPPTIEVDIKNDEVKKTLTRLTKQDLGYSNSSWQEWYIRNHTLHDYDFRNQ